MAVRREVPSPREVRIKLAAVDMKTTELAARVGLSKSYVGDWLHERTAMSAASRKKIADAIADLDEEAS